VADRGSRSDGLLEAMGRVAHRLGLGLAWSDSISGDGAKRNSRTGTAGWKRAKRLPDDPDAAAAFFKARARSRNACVVASASNLVLVEVDGPEELLGKFDLELPETVTVVSKRGRHRYYKPANGSRPAKYQLDESGVTRSEDGYLIGAGSLHPSGLVYSYVDADAELVELPAEIRERLDRLAGVHRQQIRDRVHAGGKVPKGDRRMEIFGHALELFHRGFDGDEVFRAMLVFNERHSDPPVLSREQVRDQVRGARRRAERKPRPPDPLGDELESWLNEEIPSDAKAAGQSEEPKQRKRSKARAEIFLPFGEVRLTGPPRWLWRARVPVGAVTLCAGRPKHGKSLLVVWLASQLSRGLLPGDFLDLPARTLIIAAEDPVDTIVKSRLIAADADQTRVGTLASRPPRPPTSSWGEMAGKNDQDPQEKHGGLDGLEGLDGAGAYARRVTIPDEYGLLEQIVVENEIALVCLDPINSFITAKVDAHRDAEIRRVLDPLAALAARRGFAAFGVVHLNRRTDTDVLNRITGSGGYGGSARSILTFGRHPENENQRVVAAEGNWQREAHSDLFELREIVVFPDADPDDATQPALVHVGTVDLDSSDLIDQLADDRSALEQAKDYLLGELVGGPVPVADLQRGAVANGIAWRTVERAKKLLGVEARRLSSPDSPRGAGRWEWFLELVEDEPEQ
jgi:hypothetical protein